MASSKSTEEPSVSQRCGCTHKQVGYKFYNTKPRKTHNIVTCLYEMVKFKERMYNYYTWRAFLLRYKNVRTGLQKPYRSNLVEKAALTREEAVNDNHVLQVRGTKDGERHHVTSRTEEKHRK